MPRAVPQHRSECRGGTWCPCQHQPGPAIPELRTASAEPIRPPEEICCGNPTNLDGDAHPWTEAGEDNRGTHYQCLVCGAYDVD